MIAGRAFARLRSALLAAALGGVGAGCVGLPPSEEAKVDLGRPVLRLRWKVVTSDQARTREPQEFAGVAAAGSYVYGGSTGGTFLALHADTGQVRWSVPLGSVSSRPVIGPDRLFVGTNDGELVALSLDHGDVLWRYATKGPILQTPRLVPKRTDADHDLVVFTNEADQVYALDAHTGEFRWQYKGETPEEYILRGHAGATVDGDLVFTGFGSGTLVALRLATGSVAWLTQLKGEDDRFVDVDATPVIVNDTLYVTSSSGGVWALDKTTGLVRWRMPLEGATASAAQGVAGGLTSDGERLYVTAADLGIYALDLDGNILWRQGTRGGGEPAAPVVFGDKVMYALADAGLFIADKRSGELLQYFDPGDGVSAEPVIVDEDEAYVLSNRGVLYALDLL
ncbi:MAG TPA: PQQ-binding-like beta-propeller repeat protein [Kofleriaceae bacterium]|nr:PQQ-binding-like beta-propeller repeat protein [Kofleriaceae bacterium]